MCLAVLQPGPMSSLCSINRKGVGNQVICAAKPLRSIYELAHVHVQHMVQFRICMCHIAKEPRPLSHWKVVDQYMCRAQPYSRLLYTGGMVPWC